MSLIRIPRAMMLAFAVSMSFLLVALPAAAYAASNPTLTGTDDEEKTKKVSTELVILTSSSPQACQAATTRANSDTNGTLWFAAGCILGVLGLVGAYVIEPNPPATALVGQDEQYVAEYTDCYQDTAGDIQQKQALYGCLAGTAATALIYGVLVAGALAVE